MTDQHQQFRHLKPHDETFAGLDTFPAPPRVTTVRMVSDEVTALCPVTGQPDWYEVTIAYRPDGLCVESKSLKLYFQQFRNTGIFGEAFAEQIAQDIMAACAPRWVRATIVQKPRGGISITANAKIAKDPPA
jgi:7-cyano-7-deazaguanine reductase